jgi:hypothetical protein
MNNDKWIRNLGEIANPAALEQFVTLHMALASIVLTYQRDQIFWKWTENGQFLVASAYECQFLGATIPFLSKHIWSANTVSKCNFLLGSSCITRFSWQTIA